MILIQIRKSGFWIIGGNMCVSQEVLLNNVTWEILREKLDTRKMAELPR